MDKVDKVGQNLKLKTREDHEQFLSDVLESTKGMFNYKGRDKKSSGLAPMFHVVNKEGEHILVCLAMDFDINTKDKCEEIMMMFAMDNAQAIVFISEAWMAPGQECAPSENPKRMEVLSVIYACPEGDLTVFAKIFRPKNGFPFISKWDKTDELAQAEGKLADRWQTPGLHGRFNSPYLKAKRFRKIVESRKPGFCDLTLKRFQQVFSRGTDLE